MTSAGPSELMMMLLADARLPTGAHTQSAGLEPALRGGLKPSDVPSYIKARLRTVTVVEAAAAVVARARTVEAMAAARGRADQLVPNVTAGARVNEFVRAVEDDPRGQGSVGRAAAPQAGSAAAPQAGSAAASKAGSASVRDAGSARGAEAGADAFSEAAPDAVPAPAFGLVTALQAVDAAWRARTISPALRETSVLLGRGYARLIRRLWPDTPGAAALAAIGRPGRAVVMGVAAALAGLSAAQLVRLIGYDDAQTVAAATLKLEPLDPVVTIGWVMAAGPEIERMVGDLAQLTEIEQIPALGAPLIEQWAEIHSVTNQRLFRA